MPLRGPDARTLDGRVARFALDVGDVERPLVGLQVERRPVEGFAFVGREFAHVVVEALDRHVAALVDQPRNQPSQHVGRVGYGASEEPRVEVLVRAFDLDLHVGKAA